MEKNIVFVKFLNYSNFLNTLTFEPYWCFFGHVVNLADREKQMLSTQRRLPMFALQRTTGANSWELVGAAVGKLVGGDGRIPVVVGGRCCRHWCHLWVTTTEQKAASNRDGSLPTNLPGMLFQIHPKKQQQIFHQIQKSSLKKDLISPSALGCMVASADTFEGRGSHF